MKRESADGKRKEKKRKKKYMKKDAVMDEVICDIESIKDIKEYEMNRVLSNHHEFQFYKTVPNDFSCYFHT